MRAQHAAGAGTAQNQMQKSAAPSLSIGGGSPASGTPGRPTGASVGSALTQSQRTPTPMKSQDGDSSEEDDDSSDDEDDDDDSDASSEGTPPPLNVSTSGAALQASFSNWGGMGGGIDGSGQSQGMSLSMSNNSNKDTNAAGREL